MSEFFRALEQAERDRALARAPKTAEAEPGTAVSVDPVPDVVAPPVLPVAQAVKEPAAASTVFAPPRPRRSPREDPVPLDGIPEGVDDHLVSLVTPTSFAAEQYRTLRHMIEQLHASARMSVVACTSPTGGDGKTTTAINLAGALAQAPDTEVLLVDADLRWPSIARELTLGAETGPGLVGAILNRGLALGDVVRRRSPFNLDVLPAGQIAANPYELLKSPRFAELLEEGRRRYDYVVVDTPPLVSIPDCRAIAHHVDGFLIIVAAHRTPRKLVEEAFKVMEPDKVIGLVFNADDRSLASYYDSHGAPSTGSPQAGWRGLAKGARGVFRSARSPRMQ